MACLLATVFTFGSLQKNNELIALYSAGMSLARVALHFNDCCGDRGQLFFWEIKWSPFTKKLHLFGRNC